MSEQSPSHGNSLAIKVVLPAFVFAAVVGAMLYLLQPNLPENGDSHFAPAGGAVTRGQVLPDFTLMQITGSSTKFSELRKRVVMVNFWATWCDSCMVEMPSIVALRNDYKDKGFEVAAVNLDEDPSTAVPRTVESLKISFPVFMDPDGELAKQFDVEAIPATFLLDANRRVLFMERGDRDWNSPSFRKQLEQWLSG